MYCLNNDKKALSAGNINIIVSISVLAKMGVMMKSFSAHVYKVVLVIVLFVVICLSVGCSTAQLGETSAEGHRRHLRNLRINNQEMMQDIDTALMTDKPSRLTDKRIP
jgi:hypothetical protein